MKNLLILLFISLSIYAPAQKISGFYSGTLFNDSTKMVQRYELALSEYRGKITGYSYVTFVSNDTFYYGIRKIKAHIEGDSLIVVDDKFVSNNFPEAPAKGVGRTITIPMNGQDSLVVVNGRWKTNQTKKYYTVPGAIDLGRSTDSANSPLIAHLKELNIIPATQYQNTEALAVIKAREKAEEQKRIEAEKKILDERKKAEALAKVREREEQKRIQAESKAKLDAEIKARNDEAEKNRLDAVARKKFEAEQKKKEEAEARIKQKEEDDRKKLLAAEKKKLEEEEIARQKAEAKIKEDRFKAEQAQKKLEAATVSVPVKISYDQRTNKMQQTLEVSGSDSLVLSFYDNGVVDGDSISVYVNGQVVVSNAKLTTTATKRKISMGNLNEVSILLVAENMGSIPPNTGLMTIRDGEDLYQINFSADLHTNATIVIKRKKK